MDIAVWFSVAGCVLLLMSVGGTLLARQPFSSAMFYGAAGLAISPLWWGLGRVDMAQPLKWLETLAEIVVLISLFTSGMKLSADLDDRRWLAPLRLAVIGMLLTVAAIAAAGVWWLNLPLGAAVLLGGILAPTDPVLASDVQTNDAEDRDRLRFALTGEGGLNDGTAFPMVLLGLGLLGLHNPVDMPIASGQFFWRWLSVDVVWATVAGVCVGACLGTAMGRCVLYLRRTHHTALGLDHFVGLGLIALSYGLAVQLSAYGFLAVFAAGAALRRVERQTTSANAPATTTTPAVQAGTHDAASPAIPAIAVSAAAWSASAASRSAVEEKLAVHPRHSSGFMAHAVLSFNEQLERVGEAVMVVVLGIALYSVDWTRVSWSIVGFVALLFFVIRPVSVFAALSGSRISTAQRRLIGWFGIRGIGSAYYLAFAVNKGLPAELATTLSTITLLVIAVSVVVHGVSVTPLMKLYEAKFSPASAA